MCRLTSLTAGNAPKFLVREVISMLIGKWLKAEDRRLKKVTWRMGGKWESEKVAAP
jgi:hypothetical protein